MKAFIGLGVAVVGLVAFFAFSYISAFNTANSMENGIEASWTNNKNVLSSYTSKIGEAAQIPAMQRDDLAEVVTQALDARYGEDGSQAMFQFIQEQNPQIDSAVYTQLQRMIEAGRNEFASAQTQLIDRKRAYNTALGSFWQGTMMGAAGYPKVDLDTYNIVINIQTDNAFETGTDTPMTLRP